MATEPRITVTFEGVESLVQFAEQLARINADVAGLRQDLERVTRKGMGNKIRSAR